MLVLKLAMSKNKLILSFAFLGFMIGTTAYFAFDWLGTINMKLPQILSAPWFISGIAGSIISLVVISVFAYMYSHK